MLLYNAVKKSMYPAPSCVLLGGGALEVRKLGDQKGSDTLSQPLANIMRARHIAHALPSFPVYSSAFLSPRGLVLGGGGGATRSGIKNKLVTAYNICFKAQVSHISDSEVVRCRRGHEVRSSLRG